MMKGNTITIGIYCITNIHNNKKYIGQSWNIEQRMPNNTSPHLKNSMSKYGSESFRREIKLILETQEELDYFEIQFIKFYKTTDRKLGYNIMRGGRGGKHSEETKRKMSIAKKGKPQCGTGMLGKFHSQVTKDKISKTKLIQAQIKRDALN